MDWSSDAFVDEDGGRLTSLPDNLSDGATVLVAYAGNPSQVRVCLRLLCRLGSTDDSALVVTTIESSDRTIETYDRLSGDGDCPSLGLVDTASEQQSITALYDETPVVFTPAQGDLERLVLALSELSGTSPPARGSRHLVLRSLTPILDASSTASVCTVLGRITGLRSERGLCLLGLDYTAHTEATMARLAEEVDGILWTTRSSSDDLEFEYRPARAYLNSIAPRSDADE